MAGFFDETDMSVDYTTNDSVGVERNFGQLDNAQSETTLNGTQNTPPLVSTTMQTDTPGNSPFTGIQKLLGSIGPIARDFGTAVGTIKRQINGAPIEYQKAENAAATGDKASQWWQYSSTTDKLTVGIGLAGLFLLLRR